MTKLPVTVVSFAVYVFGRFVLATLRINYLREASKTIEIDPSVEIVLCYPVWYNILYPIVGIGLTIISVHEIFIYRNNFDLIAAIIASIFFFFVPIWLLYTQLKTRVIIKGWKLIYEDESDHRELRAGEVSDFSLNGFKFIIKRFSGKAISIPSTFKNSEVIFAFLKAAMKQPLSLNEEENKPTDQP